LGDDHYHTHLSWDSMQEVSYKDIELQRILGRNPPNILYENKIYQLHNNPNSGYFYKKTKITF